MSTVFACRSFAKVFSFACLLLVIGLCVQIKNSQYLARAHNDDSSAFAFSEEFDQQQLGEGWSWVRENPGHWSLTERPGYLRIWTAFGTLDGGVAENVLLRAAPSGSYEVSTKIEFEPILNYHEACLLLYDDDNNYIKLSRLYHSAMGGQKLLLLWEKNGSHQSAFAASTMATVFELKLVRENNRVRGLFKAGTDNWTEVGQITLDGTSRFRAVGAAAHNGNLNISSMPADFDFFRVKQLGAIRGRVTDGGGNGIAGVRISASAGASVTTDHNGNYTLSGLTEGTYTLTPSKSGYWFRPTSRTVTVPPDAMGQDFVATPCVAPSGLNVCALQPGDILLKTGPTFGYCGELYRAAFHIGGTYFTHSALYLGNVAAPGGDLNDVRPRIAEAQGYRDNDDDEVWETWLADTQFSTGQCVTDWVVVRPIASTRAINGAIAYARRKAAEDNVIFDIFAGKEDPQKFYCSKLVWKSYRDGTPDGPDLEADRGIGGGELGLLFRTYWVSPDDLFYSSPIVQEKSISPGQRIRRGFFYIWSPGHLTLVDPLGRRAGYDPATGGTFSEIPEASYFAPPGVMAETITAPGIGSDWQLIVTGFDTGTYGLESGYADQRTRRNLLLGSTYPGKTETYPVADPIYATFLPMVLRNR